MKHKRTLIFLSPPLVPECISKSKWYWNHSLWKEFNTVYLSCKIPLSDAMVTTHLEELDNFTSLFPDPILVGNYMGSWWGANLACRLNKLKGLILFNPFSDHFYHPLMNATENFNFLLKTPLVFGPSKVLVYSVLPDNRISNHFNSILYSIKAFDFAPNINHLDFMKDWLEII